MSKRNGTRTLIAWVLLIVLCITTIPYLQEVVELFSFSVLPHLHSDGFAYWSTFKLLMLGGNPYDSAQLEAYQRTVSEVSMVPMYLPPWNMALLSPLVAWSFPVFSAGLFMLNALLLVLALNLGWRFYSKNPPSIPLIAIIGITFLPALQVIRSGQLALIITVSLYGSVLLLRADRNFLAGILLSVAIMKPQTAYLAALAIGLDILVRRNWYAALGFILSAVGMFSTVTVLFPKIWQFWLQAHNDPFQWYAASIISVIRLVLTNFGLGAYPTWPCIFIPCVAILLVLFFRPDPLRNLASLICLSQITSPYLFIYEFSAMILIGCGIMTLFKDPNYPQKKAAIAFCCYALCMLGLLLLWIADFLTWEPAWIPVGLLLISVLFLKKTQALESSPART